MKPPLGDQPYKIAIRRDELRVLLAHRERTGEPMQSLVRRLIREQGESYQAGQPVEAAEAAAGAAPLACALRKVLGEAARTERREPEELLADAVRQYLHKHHRALLARGGQARTCPRLHAGGDEWALRRTPLRGQ